MGAAAAGADMDCRIHLWALTAGFFARKCVVQLHISQLYMQLPKFAEHIGACLFFM